MISLINLRLYSIRVSGYCKKAKEFAKPGSFEFNDRFSFLEKFHKSIERFGELNLLANKLIDDLAKVF